MQPKLMGPGARLEPTPLALATPRLQILTFDGRDRLDAVRGYAAQLAPAATLPTQHGSWIEAFALTFARRGGLRILVAARGDRALALLALVRHPDTPYFEMLNLAKLYEPADVLCADPAALPPLAGSLAEHSKLLLFHRLPADSPLVGPLKQAMRGRGLIITRPDVSWPVIPLDARWVEPERQLNAGRRSDLRRARRRAEALGPVSLEMLSPAPETLSPLLAEAYAIEAAGWKGAAGSALAMDPMLGEFFRHYAAAAARDGILRLGFLKIGDQRAAMLLAVELAQRLWLLKIGYDEQFARCSPGMLLVSETVRDAARRGLKAYEFLGEPAEWTRVWTRVERRCIALHAFSLRLQGLSAFTARLGRWALNQVI
jgi:CelD/BcsL family acetyltransferase involved in cellulose biosynthesis